MLLIIGLGNYTPEYKNTRHNFGFMAIDALANELNFPKWKTEKKFFADITSGELKGQKIILCKPRTFMNLSGKAVLVIKNFYKIPIKNCFVFSDDLDLPFGVSRFRQKGSGGGQKGLSDIIRVFGSQDFSRIRFGINNEKRSIMSTEDFVLSRFTKKEKENIPEIILDGLEKFWNNI
jgi:PTH1 family peptidyl-tRNA hydrolase